MLVTYSELMKHERTKVGTTPKLCMQCRTHQSAIFLLSSWTAGTNPTDFTFKFKSLCIRFIGHEVQLTLHRNVIQRDIFFSLIFFSFF